MDLAPKVARTTAYAGLSLKFYGSVGKSTRIVKGVAGGLWVCMEASLIPLSCILKSTVRDQFRTTLAKVQRNPRGKQYFGIFKGHVDFFVSTNSPILSFHPEGDSLFCFLQNDEFVSVGTRTLHWLCSRTSGSTRVLRDGLSHDLVFELNCDL